MVVPSELNMPVSVYVASPAAAVSITFWPLIVPVSGADPLSQIAGPLWVCDTMEKTAAPVTEPLFCSRNPPCRPPDTEEFAALVIEYCQLPESVAL